MRYARFLHIQLFSFAPAHVGILMGLGILLGIVVWQWQRRRQPPGKRLEPSPSIPPIPPLHLPRTLTVHINPVARSIEELCRETRTVPAIPLTAAQRALAQALLAKSPHTPADPSN